MKKEHIHPMPDYFDRYIHKTDDVPVLEALEISLKELGDLPLATYKELGDKVYAPGKWTVKDTFQHLVDTERVFAYRALAFSRSEPGKVLSYDEAAYAGQAHGNNRSLEDLIEELKIVRRSFMELYRSFDDNMLLKKGQGFSGEYSVLSIGFIIPGHQRWHMQLLEQNYFPLLKH